MSGALPFAQRYGPWAVVTGASEGIGLAFAQQLAARGLHLVLVARRGAALQALAASLQQAHGVQCRVLAVDLATHAADAQLVEVTRSLDVGLLVAAAGFGSAARLADADLEAEAGMVDLNCRAVLLQAAHFALRLQARGRGGIVLMSSLLAFQGVPGSANYAATKAYVQSLAEGLRAELAASGVDVIASAPGPVHTGFARRADLRMAQAARPDAVAAATLAALGHGSTVRPGGLAKLLGWSLATLPRSGRVHIMGRVMASMTAHRAA